VDTSDQMTQVWPIAAYFIILAAMLVLMMLLSHFLVLKVNSERRTALMNPALSLTIKPALPITFFYMPYF
jgi:hypothetical protein